MGLSCIISASVIYTRLHLVCSPLLWLYFTIRTFWFLLWRAINRSYKIFRSDQSRQQSHNNVNVSFHKETVLVTELFRSPPSLWLVSFAVRRSEKKNCYHVLCGTLVKTKNPESLLVCLLSGSIPRSCLYFRADVP